jgi:predicted phage terminase large subunit-like protein
MTTPPDKRKLAVSTLNGFVRYLRPEYLMGWVHEVICRELDVFLKAAVERESPRLMLTMPPRHGKSELVSRMFPAYAMGRNPDLSIIATSYGADLASRNNRDVQRIIDSPRYRGLFPATRLWGKNIRTVADGSYQRNSDIFEVVGRLGSYRSAGVGGGITGMGGECIIIDDPIKNREEADSGTFRDKIWEWYLSTLYTRLAPGGGIVLIQTRWHLDDLAGRLLEAERAGEGDSWRKLAFPALAEADEDHRRAGEALHPERYGVAELRNIKRNLGSREWGALYQQRPAPEEGAIFERGWFKYWTRLPDKFDRVILSWDLTFKDTAGTDYVVGQAWGQAGSEAYLLDQVRKRMGFVETCEALARFSAKWPQALRKLIEDKANGPAVIDALRRTIPGIVPVEPDGSKVARAHSVTPVFEAGNVYLPDRSVASWVGDLESELLNFPTAAHDDQVDALTQALRHFFRRRPMTIDPAVISRVEGRRAFQPWAGRL